MVQEVVEEVEVRADLGRQVGAGLRLRADVLGDVVHALAEEDPQRGLVVVRAGLEHGVVAEPADGLPRVYAVHVDRDVLEPVVVLADAESTGAVDGAPELAGVRAAGGGVLVGHVGGRQCGPLRAARVEYGG